jgi:hypothetical protein
MYDPYYHGADKRLWEKRAKEAEARLKKEQEYSFWQKVIQRLEKHLATTRS